MLLIESFRVPGTSLVVTGVCKRKILTTAVWCMKFSFLKKFEFFNGLVIFLGVKTCLKQGRIPGRKFDSIYHFKEVLRNYIK